MRAAALRWFVIVPRPLRGNCKMRCSAAAHANRLTIPPTHRATTTTYSHAQSMPHELAATPFDLLTNLRYARSQANSLQQIK